MVTGGGVEPMDLGNQACFGTTGLSVNGCVTLGKIFEIQFLDLKIEKYKYMPSNIGHIKWDDLYQISGSRWGLDEWKLLLSFIFVYYIQNAT